MNSPTAQLLRKARENWSHWTWQVSSMTDTMIKVCEFGNLLSSNSSLLVETPSYPSPTQSFISNVVLVKYESTTFVTMSALNFSSSVDPDDDSSYARAKQSKMVMGSSHGFILLPYSLPLNRFFDIGKSEGNLHRFLERREWMGSYSLKVRMNVWCDGSFRSMTSAVVAKELKSVGFDCYAVRFVLIRLISIPIWYRNLLEISW